MSDQHPQPWEEHNSGATGHGAAGAGEVVSDDGQYRWDPAGGQWLPRNQGWRAVAPLPQQAGGRVRRRAVVIVVGLLVAATVAVVVLVSTRGAGGDGASAQDTGSTADASVTSHATACKYEVEALADLYLDQGMQAVSAVIGYSSPLFELATELTVKYQSDVSQYGRSGAMDRVNGYVMNACTQAGNPILKQAQLTDLITALGDSKDSDALKRITVFAN